MSFQDIGRKTPGLPSKMNGLVSSSSTTTAITKQTINDSTSANSTAGGTDSYAAVSQLILQYQVRLAASRNYVFCNAIANVCDLIS